MENINDKNELEIDNIPVENDKDDKEISEPVETRDCSEEIAPETEADCEAAGTECDRNDAIAENFEESENEPTAAEQSQYVPTEEKAEEADEINAPEIKEEINSTAEEADKITVAPIGKAPELPKPKKQPKEKKKKDSAESVRQERHIDKIMHILLYLLLATPLAILAYIIVTYFL